MLFLFSMWLSRLLHALCTVSYRIFHANKKKKKKKKARCWIMNLHDRQLDSQPRRGKCVILCPRSVNIPAALLLNVQTRDWVWKCACVFKENSLSGELDGQEIESPLSPMFSLRLSSSGSNFGLKRRRKRGKKSETPLNDERGKNWLTLIRLWNIEKQHEHNGIKIS